ncbi:hypothetical protein [Legionella longbeachae]|uniref:Uncharacterized protein n=1 Tax=Legionella longbeachae serogroup 1 (strain NSW150) TaxID=661367 RepID=D3HJI9_LEGLN|nr:hypothetical protein [Legionella longbeachae]VEE03117.1 ATPase involved in DNA repair [Legionella oakridgensis]HBD7399237.1 hypothetical protein [Legionella pneumophila]ARB93982.1 hypothetical protein A6J40_18125 [Legionella longbeachae]ARM32880.1 hypothetical protein B0B39_04825 [Legionella longbeachae]EEZ94308.1 conserved hypothetical protein [Legionella longbeachae D-4968]
MSFTLTLLGTDTQFTPNHLENAYDKAETLSYISTLINNESTMPTDDVTRFRNQDVAVIDGPTTLGSEVGDRIARGVAAVLEAISRGETNISVIAHSRGAIEAILVAHELERLQNLIKENGIDSFSSEILNSVCKYTKTAMSGSHKGVFESLKWDEISKHISDVKISMLNIDPVPGGNYLGVTHVSSLAWRDPRFYEVPKIVKEYEQIVYENERTRCFKPIVPKCASPETKFKLQSLPGHHGTGSGNLLDQQRGKNPSEKSTAHVQELALVKLIDFLKRNGVNVTPRPQKDDPFSELMTELFEQEFLPWEKRLKDLYFKLYNQIIENKEAYLNYNKTSYAVLGQEQALLKLIWNVADQRIVHYLAHNDTFLDVIIPPVPGGHFLNYEHARMHLNHELGLSDDIPLSGTLDIATQRLVKICEHTKKLQELKDLKKKEPNTELQDMTESIMFDKIAHAIDSKEGFELLLQGLTTLIEEVRQTYLQNKLINPEERSAVYEAVQRTFSVFSNVTQIDPHNELATKIFEQLKSDLETTLTMKRNTLKDQYQELANKLKEKQFINELDGKIQKIIDNLEEKKAEGNTFENEILIEKLKGFILKSEQLQGKSPLSYEVKQFLEQEFSELSKLEFSSELSINSREWSCLLIDEAVDENLTYLLPHIIQEVIASSNELDQFRKALPDFKVLDNTLDYEQLETELEEYKSRVIYLAAQYIHRHKIPLQNVQEIFGDEHQDIFQLIEGLAVGMGVVNPLALTIEEKLHVIQELSLTNKQQANQIVLLTQDRQQQAELINKLEHDFSKQADLINSLVSGNEDKAKVIVLLTDEKDKQMQFANALTSSNEEQQKLIVELSRANDLLEEENQNLRGNIAHLNQQLEILRAEQNTTATVDDEYEFKLQIIIKRELTPLTKDYLIHLAKEIKNNVDPTLDVNDFPNLANNVRKIQSWPENKSTRILKQKFDKISELHDILEAKNKPSIKVGQFYNQLNEAERLIETHRDSEWKRYTLIALSILVTGILPGFGVLAYSAITGNTPKFWQSSGQTFFQSAKKLENNVSNPDPIDVPVRGF